MVAMNLIYKLLLLYMLVVLNLFATLVQPVPSYTGRCCRDGQKGEQGDPGLRGQRGSQGEKGARGLPGICNPQMVERMNLILDSGRERIRSHRNLTLGSGMERIRSRRDRSDGGEEEGEEGVKNMLTTLFGRCVDTVLADDEGSSAFRVSVVKGEKGEKGDRGDSIRGEMGLPGPSGPIGPPGLKGERGEMGDMGNKGEQGVKGEKGCEGPMGPVGNTGARGPVGRAGPRGPPGPQGERGQTGRTGLVYIRWGECTCSPDTTLLYDGIIVQAASMLTNLLCIPKEPTSSNQSDASTNATPRSHFTRMEPLLYTNQMGTTDAIPCALCHVTNQSTIFTFSGRSTCPGDWTRQYSGYLTTSYELSTTDVLCADEKLSREIRWRDADTGAVVRNGVNMLETVCEEGVASCQGYEAGQLMPCVVCSN